MGWLLPSTEGTSPVAERSVGAAAEGEGEGDTIGGVGVPSGGDGGRDGGAGGGGGGVADAATGEEGREATREPVGEGE